MRKEALEGFGEGAAIRRWGDGARIRTPLILLPGTSCAAGVYDLLAPPLADRPLLGIDWPERHPLFREGMDGFAELLARMLEAAGVGGPIALAGNSFGAMLALHVALRSRAQVAALVLIGGCASGEQIYPHLRKIHAILRRVPPRLLAPFFAGRRLLGPGRGLSRTLIALAHFAIGPFDGMPAEAWELIPREVGVWPIEKVGAVVDAFMPWDVRAEVGSLRVPALVIHGTEDRLIPFAAGEWLGRNLPDARFVPFPGVGHAPMITRPEETAAAILSFLDPIRTS